MGTPTTIHEPVVALSAAVTTEITPTVRRFRLTASGNEFHGRVGRARVVAVVSGMGAERALRTFHQLLDQHHPTHVVLLGFAGGLDPSLKAADAVRVDWVSDGRGTVADLNDHTPTLGPDDPARDPRRSLVTLQTVACTREQKRTLFAQHRCAAVDTETFHVAQAASQTGTRLSVIRVISDTASCSLPNVADKWVRPDGSPDIGAVVRHLARHPWQLPAVMRLGRAARQAAERLSKEVDATIHSEL